MDKMSDNNVNNKTDPCFEAPSFGSSKELMET